MSCLHSDYRPDSPSLVSLFTATVHPWRTHGKDLGLLVEPQRTLGHLFGFRRQHNASLADGESSRDVVLSPKYTQIRRCMAAKIIVIS